MHVLLALLLPPVGMFICGKVLKSFLCSMLMMTLIGWPIAVIWAVMVVSKHDAEIKSSKIVKKLPTSNQI